METTARLALRLCVGGVLVGAGACVGQMAQDQGEGSSRDAAQPAPDGAPGSDATAAPDATLADAEAPDAGNAGCAPPGYALTFQDEFDATDAAFPSERWATTFVNWGQLRTLAGNGEEQIYSDPGLGVDPFAVAGGVLTISGDRAEPAVEGFAYTSGLITTEGYENYPPGWPMAAFAQKYGYFEMRVRLPAGRGLWPAFWLVGVSSDTHYEIDIFEVLGHEPSRIYQSTHLPSGGAMKESGAVDTADGFHVYGLLWTSTDLVWNVDCVETNSQAVGSEIPVPMYLLANLAIGGTWPGSPDSSTPFPANMEVDYVRVYQAP